MQAAYRDPFDRVADFFLTRKQAALLEIGCDNVEQMKSFIDRSYLCTAINPGAGVSETVKFVDGFYGSTNIPESFDYVVSRFNLEHIINVEKFFKSLDKNLKQDGLAIFQVPNAAFFLKAGLLNILAHEHPHYFCKQSLSKLLSRHGYEVLSISRDDEVSIICVFTRRDSKHNPKLSLQKASGALSELRSFLQRFQGVPVYVYGVSLSLAGMIYSKLIEPDLLVSIRLIDDNPALHGKYMPLTDIKVEPVEKAGLAADSIVLLSLNPIYYPVVIRKLKALNVRDNIFAVNNQGVYQIKEDEVIK
jgi:hypothetical protein